MHGAPGRVGAQWRIVPSPSAVRGCPRLYQTKHMALHPPRTRWVVITGPPSSGKSTLLRLFEEAGEQTSGDSTRALLADVAAAGRDAKEFRFADDFQPRALQAMAAAEGRLDRRRRVYLEYALPCNIAFHRTEGRALTPGLAEAARRVRYEAVFILAPLQWENDAQRVEDAEYQAKVHRHMFDVYRELGYEPIAVPVMSPSERRDFVLAAIL